MNSVDIHLHRSAFPLYERAPAFDRNSDFFQPCCPWGLHSHGFHELDRGSLRSLLCTICTLLFPSNSHSLPPKCVFSALFDIFNAFHCLDCSLHKFSVVANRNVSAFLEIDGRVNSHLLAVGLPEGFRPPHFTRVALHFEIFVAFRGAKPKYFGVVTDKSRSMPWVDACRAEVALFDAHRYASAVRKTVGKLLSM